MNIAHILVEYKSLANSCTSKFRLKSYTEIHLWKVILANVPNESVEILCNSIIGVEFLVCWWLQFMTCCVCKALALVIGWPGPLLLSATSAHSIVYRVQYRSQISMYIHICIEKSGIEHNKKRLVSDQATTYIGPADKLCIWDIHREKKLDQVTSLFEFWVYPKNNALILVKICNSESIWLIQIQSFR